MAGNPPRALSLNERIWARHLLQELYSHTQPVRKAMDPQEGVRIVTDVQWAEQWQALKRALDVFTEDVIAGRPVTQITNGGGRLG
jgi:hypothetical protein